MATSFLCKKLFDFFTSAGYCVKLVDNIHHVFGICEFRIVNGHKLFLLSVRLSFFLVIKLHLEEFRWVSLH